MNKNKLTVTIFFFFIKYLHNIIILYHCLTVIKAPPSDCLAVKHCSLTTPLLTESYSWGTNGYFSVIL